MTEDLKKTQIAIIVIFLLICKFVWKKLLNYLKNKGKSDIEIENVFVELSKSKYGNN